MIKGRKVYPIIVTLLGAAVFFFDAAAVVENHTNSPGSEKTELDSENPTPSSWDTDDDENQDDSEENSETVGTEKNHSTMPTKKEEEPMPLIRREREPVQYSSDPQSKFIHHPNAQLGLTKITRDKVYLYKVKVSDQTRASSLHFGVFSPTHLSNPDTGESFTQFYPTYSPLVLFDYEWQIWRRLGKLGLKVGAGIAMTTGSGQFEHDYNGDLPPLEKFTFVVVPTSAGAIYRFQFWDKQFLVPYAEGGGVVFGFSELRDDGKRPKVGGAFGLYGAGGLALKMDFLDPVSMMNLDRDYSINSVYLFAEYRVVQGFGRFDFTSNLINGGFLVEF